MRKVKKSTVKAKTEDSFQKLKVGTEVFYMTQYTLDRTIVEEVLRDGTAILANRVKVSRDISFNGYLTLKQPLANDKTIIRVWSPEVEEEYKYQLSLRNIPNLTRSIDKLVKDAGKEAVINIYNKLNKIIKKYE